MQIWTYPPVSILSISSACTAHSTAPFFGLLSSPSSSLGRGARRVDDPLLTYSGCRNFHGRIGILSRTTPKSKLYSSELRQKRPARQKLMAPPPDLRWCVRSGCTEWSALMAWMERIGDRRVKAHRLKERACGSELGVNSPRTRRVEM